MEGVVKKNFKDQWQIYDGAFKKYEGQKVSTIYFSVELSSYKGDYLKIESAGACSVFLNGKLSLRDGKAISLSIDSLQKVTGQESVWVAIHDKQCADLKTFLVSPTVVNEFSPHPEHALSRDFIIVAALIMVTLLLLIIYLNPKLASDYFSVTRMFSFRESDEVQLSNRITNSTNILFYAYGSLLFALCLLLIFNQAETLFSEQFRAESFSQAFLFWFELTLIMLGFFLLKILWVYMASTLFAFQDQATFQYFNWTRLLLITNLIIAAILITYFISYGNSGGFYFTMLRVIGIALSGWLVIIFLKFSRRVSASVFHIFSYLCATEIIPLLITLKVLFD